MPSQLKAFLKHVMLVLTGMKTVYGFFAEYLFFYHLAHIIILLFSVFTEEKSKQISTHVKCIIRQGCSCFSISNEFFQMDPNSLDTPHKQVASNLPENLSKIVRL